MTHRSIHDRNAETLIRLFNAEFECSEKTLLVGGATEPYFEPGIPSRVHFRADYFRSALHEVAHWCLAGSVRRTLPDYGYWYSADGRDVSRQRAFFAVEARPQALESIFCEACAEPFSPSLDNTGIEVPGLAVDEFQRRLAVCRQRFELEGLPLRARRFHVALLNAFATQVAA